MTAEIFINKAIEYLVIYIFKTKCSQNIINDNCVLRDTRRNWTFLLKYNTKI